MNILRYLSILLIFLSCNNSQQKLYSINDQYINNYYKIDEIFKEDNLVRDTLIIESIKNLFRKDINQNNAYYGNWWGYYYISKSENRTLILRVDEDKIFDEILITIDINSNQYYCYHVAREYYDGDDFELMSAELENNKLTKNLIVGYFDLDSQSDIVVLDTIIYQKIMLPLPFKDSL